MESIQIKSSDKSINKEVVISRAGLKRLKSIKNRVIPIEVMKEILGNNQELPDTSGLLELKKKEQECCVLM
jgi:hypothetical protein